MATNLTNYTFDKLVFTTPRLAQYASILPLLHDDVFSSSLPRAVQADRTTAALTKLLKLYRKQLKILVADRRISDEQYRLMVNCRPPFLNYPQKGWTCQRYLLCPFCWSTKVTSDLYDRLIWAVFGSLRNVRLSPATRHRQPLVPRALDLVEYYHDRYYPFSDSLEAITDVERGRMAETQQWLKKPALGRYSLVTIAPTQDRWLVRLRMLVLIKPHVPEELTITDQPFTWIYRRSYPVTHTHLAMAVSRIAQYPIALLTAAADRVQQIFALRQDHKLRLARCQGNLRNGPERRQAEEALRRKWAEDPAAEELNGLEME